MRRLPLASLIFLASIVGCKTTGESKDEKTSHKLAPSTYSEYHLEGWSWNGVGRVLVLPVWNESGYTQATEEVRAALTGELQRLGRFEVIAGPADDRALLAGRIHRGGRFDEATMLEIGHATKADVVLHVTVTHYSPYPRPRIGLIIQAVGPREAKVVASVDGLWDTTDMRIADRLRTYYRQKSHAEPAFIKNHVIASDDSFAAELALDSPALFQRFVTHEAALVLLGLPVPGITVKYKHGKDE